MWGCAPAARRSFRSLTTPDGHTAFRTGQQRQRRSDKVFLKKAVFQGFKSFADRTEFEFGAGITTIVGPNGSGKSNILDAVRWVLGEQSARSLRGDHMADVIFAGSRSRKPANFAAVELTFDNRAGILRSDQPEVSVGRMLYRSGESEYRLNGNPCRLKDIRELLLDTGVGVDAYSVIEQGRVDALLQASAIERREIFEEAAGISRYKLRRIEAQRKLERTQNNLLRLQDIVDELERRLRSVRLAAGKARNYQQYDARLRELRASFSLAAFHTLEQNRTLLQREVDDLAAVLADERARLAEEDAAAAELARDLQAQDDHIQAGETELRAVETTLAALSERVAQGERRAADLSAARQRWQTQAADAAQRLADLQTRLAHEDQQLRELHAAEQQSQTHAEQLQSEQAAGEQRCTELRAALDHERIAAFEAVRRAALIQNDRTNLDQQRARLTAVVERLSARQREINDELASLCTRRNALRRQADELDRQAAALAASLRTDEARLAELESEATQLDQDVGAAKEARSAALSRLGLLQDMERRLEGVDHGTQTALAWRAHGGDAGAIIGLVADLLRIDDPRVAILEPVLATFENHVVVRDTAAFLRTVANAGQLPGPLRVLALDRLATRPMAAGYESLPGFVARASDWVTCAAEYRPLAEHLLGRTIILDSLDRALRWAAEALAGYVFVTLDGWTVRGDGRLTYGSASAAPGLISRKAEIRQLRTEVDDLENRLVLLTRRRLEVEQASSDVQLRKHATLAEIAQRQREHADLRAQIVRGDDEHARLEREHALTTGDLDAQQRALAELVEQLQHLAAEDAAVAGAQQTHEQCVAQVAADLAQAETEVEQLKRARTEALVARSRAAERRAAGEATVHDLLARCTALDDETQHARVAADEATAQIGAAQAEVAAARQQQAERAALRDQQQAALLDRRQRRQELRAQLETDATATRERQRRIEAAETAGHERQMALRECEVRREALVARVQEELGLDLQTRYAGYEPQPQDQTAVEAEIEELRAKIARLGNVNLDAITELDELTPRYEHLMAQRTDLVSSIERLQTLIEQLDTESRRRFSAAFEHIRASFQEMFRKLFGGGRADIILEDPENPLECGIDIVARPPGKEPQSISLLSGGEKTLTAVALLLGIFRTRPSPFTILDEVDAALDEANTERFNTVLQEFLRHTQFLVITHSKRTMAVADVLYGITMEEPGVSKRVSVRFEERVNTPNVA